ncbi:MAG: hypothetical protein AAGE52_05895 [Myxococcota bacterium]
MNFVASVLANDLEQTRIHLDAGADASEGLPWTTTVEMLELLLERGAKPEEAATLLEAAAREGQLEIAQLLLRHAPGLATEDRALMAADHPETERVIREVARGDDVDALVDSKSALRATRVRPTFGAPAPHKKTSTRFYFPSRPRMDLDEARARTLTEAIDLSEDDVVFAAASGVMIFGTKTRWVGNGEAILLDIPPLDWPYEHAVDEAGEHFFFAYGQRRLLGITRDGSVVVDEDLPGAGWGKAIVRLPGEPEGGHSYPARLCIAGHWLAAVSLERIHLVPFGPHAGLPMQWFTCQLGTCAVPLREGRAILVGARAGGALFGIDGDRVERLANVEPTLFEGTPSALHQQLRMALRVSGRGHNDPRSLNATVREGGSTIVARGVGGMDERTLFVPGLQVDSAELEASWPTRPEITDAWETPEGEIRVRVQPVGRDDVRAFRLNGVDELLDSAFAALELGSVEGFAVVASPIPRPYPPPHQSMGTLSYPEVGPAGYAFGHKVSRRPGKWNSYVVDAEGVHAFEPHWFSGVTYSGFHPREPRLVAGTAREVIEVDLATRTWEKRDVNAAVRGVAYVGAGLAVHAGAEVMILDSLHAKPRRVLKAPVSRNANMVSLHGATVLWIPVEDRSVLLALRGTELVVLGVLNIGATGKHESPEGEILALEKGAARLVGLDHAIAEAKPLEGDDLTVVSGPLLTQIDRST